MAQSRRVSFIDAALALGVLSPEQARALMASAGSSSGARPGSSGEFDATFRWSHSGEASAVGSQVGESALVTIRVNAPQSQSGSDSQRSWPELGTPAPAPLGQRSRALPLRPMVSGEADKTFVPSATAQPPSRDRTVASPGLGGLVQGSFASLFTNERYEVLRELRPGRQVVRDRRLGNELLRVSQVQVGSAEAQAEFFREARVLSQFDHPAIPKVHDLGFAPLAYFTMDLPLAEVAEEIESENKFWDVSRELRVVLDVAKAVAHAHERGVFHGHLVAAAIVRGEHGQVQVGGWSEARALKNAPPRLASELNRPRRSEVFVELRAPEIDSGEVGDERSDVWGSFSLR